LRKHDSFFAALGRFTFAWNRLEFSLDLLLRIVALDQIGSSLSPPVRRLPYQLSAKTKLLRNLAREEQWLAPFKDRIERLTAEVDALSLDRNDYLHGAMFARHADERPMAMTLSRFLQPAPPRKPVKVTAKTFLSAGKRAWAIADEMLPLAEAVKKASDIELPRRLGLRT
jgi:hypothetical protein